MFAETSTAIFIPFKSNMPSHIPFSYYINTLRGAVFACRILAALFIVESPDHPVHFEDCGDAGFEFPNALKDAELRQVNNWEACTLQSLHWGHSNSQRMRMAS
jgi:hypothetical protein